MNTRSDKPHTYIHTSTTYIHTYIHTCINHIHTYIHTYIHASTTYIHTYIHTYIRTKAQNLNLLVKITKITDLPKMDASGSCDAYVEVHSSEVSNKNWRTSVWSLCLICMRTCSHVYFSSIHDATRVCMHVSLLQLHANKALYWYILCRHMYKCMHIYTYTRILV